MYAHCTSLTHFNSTGMALYETEVIFLSEIATGHKVAARQRPLTCERLWCSAKCKYNAGPNTYKHCTAAKEVITSVLCWTARSYSCYYSFFCRCCYYLYSYNLVRTVCRDGCWIGDQVKYFRTCHIEPDPTTPTFPVRQVQRIILPLAVVVDGLFCKLVQGNVRNYCHIFRQSWDIFSG